MSDYGSEIRDARRAPYTELRFRPEGGGDERLCIWRKLGWQGRDGRVNSKPTLHEAPSNFPFWSFKGGSQFGH